MRSYTTGRHTTTHLKPVDGIGSIVLMNPSRICETDRKDSVRKSWPMSGRQHRD